MQLETLAAAGAETAHAAGEQCTFDLAAGEQRMGRSFPIDLAPPGHDLSKSFRPHETA